MILKKILKITGIVVLVLLALAFIIPIAFKKQITGIVRSEINKKLNATINFDDVSLSLFRHFPKVSISIEELSVIGAGRFEHDTLLYTKTADASANLMSVIKGDEIKIYGIYLESPRIHALVDKDGNANWDIAKETPDTGGSQDSSGSTFKMSLKKYEISDGYIEYSDQTTNTYAQISGLDHSGSGDFTESIFTLSTNTRASSASFTQDAIPYLVNTNTGIDADIKVDNSTGTYTFNTEDILLNNLKLSAEGFFQIVNDSTYDMDIKFKSPANSFKDILSLVPAVYKSDFDKLNASGEAALHGFVKGKYSPQQMPSYDVNLEVRNASFQYPDLPKPVKNIQLDLRASNPDGQPDNAVLDISKGHLEMNNEPFDFRFLLKNPETVRYIDAAVKGKLNLSQLGQFIKLEKGTKLAGQVLADAFVRGNMAALQDQQAAFAAGGFFNVKNLFFSSRDFPQPIRNGSMNIKMENTGGIADNTVIDISSGHVEVGNDPVDFNLQLTNPVTLFNFDGGIRGRFTLDNLKQFMALDPGTAIAGLLNADLKFAGNKRLIEKEQYDKIRFSGEASLNKVRYVSRDYPTGITVSNAAATFSPSNATISKFSGSYLKSNFTGNGTLNNVIGFALNNEPLNGVLNANVDKMDLNDWMGTEETGTTPEPGASTAQASAPFLVPANLDLTLNAKAGKVKYDKVDYKNINGVLLLNNETVKLQDVKAEALDGSILLNGSYSTRSHKSNPDITLSYDIKDMDVQKAFLSYNTIQAIMPIGKFLSGKLSSELSMTGSLDGNMMPDLGSLSGKGNLLLIEGVLNKFAPLEKLASTLQIDRLKSISIKDIKNYIEFSNGKVLVRPFNLKVDDMELQIGGMHGFDQSMDYVVAMRVPRKYLGTEGNNLVNGLANQAINRGIPVKLGEMVDLNVRMGGSMTNPTVKVDLEKVAGDAMNELKDQAKDFAQQKLDSASARARDTLTVIKDKAKEELKAKAMEQLFGKDTTRTGILPDTAKKKPSAVKETLKGLLKKPKGL